MDRWNAVMEHLRWVYTRAGREYTLHAAAWYEANEPWLAGLAAKVRAGIESRIPGQEVGRNETPVRGRANDRPS